MSTYKTLADITDLKGKRVLVRSELNAPVADGVVTDDYRVLKAIPTLQHLSKKGARTIVCAHLGRNPEDSLAPVFGELQKHLPHVQFVPDVVGDEAHKAVLSLQDGEVLLLENLRSSEGEKSNDTAYAKALAAHADLYVDDAFGVTHREHASVVGVPEHIPGFAGLLLEEEITELSHGLEPASPSLFILGGAKFETKEKLLEVILERYDTVFIGGALANDFLKAEGFEVGESLVSGAAKGAKKLMETGKILLPVDVVVERAGEVHVKRVDSVQKNEKILDIGPETVTELGMKIAHAASILWNGPLGYFEGGYDRGTQEVAQLVADVDAHSIVGGGDTVAAIRDLHLEKHFGFVSTGGGAMLDYLVDGKLPGVAALEA